MRPLAILAPFLAIFALFITETIVAAQTPEVPHPTLPAGAGKIEADAPKAFTSTPSGLQYRVLRKGTGAAPGRRAT